MDVGVGFDAAGDEEETAVVGSLLPERACQLVADTDLQSSADAARHLENGVRGRGELSPGTHLGLGRDHAIVAIVVVAERCLLAAEHLDASFHLGTGVEIESDVEEGHLLEEGGDGGAFGHAAVHQVGSGHAEPVASLQTQLVEHEAVLADGRSIAEGHAEGHRAVEIEACADG